MERGGKSLLLTTLAAVCVLAHCASPALASGAEKEVPIGTYVTKPEVCQEGNKYKGTYEALVSRDDGLVYSGGHCDLKKNKSGMYLRCEDPSTDGPDYNVKFNISSDRKTITIKGATFYSCGRTIDDVF